CAPTSGVACRWRTSRRSRCSTCSRRARPPSSRGYWPRTACWSWPRPSLVTVDPAKEERLATGLGPWFDLESARTVTIPLRLSRADAAALVGMGPSARHLDAATVADRLAE